MIANRALAREGIVDAFGHISARHPRHADRFILAWSRAPELIEPGDLMEFDLDGTPVAPDPGRPPYLERFIHAAVYADRPEIMAVCHNHTASILPFGISRTARLQAVIHTAALLGTAVPVWNIADDFGPNTNLLVVNLAQGRSLARTLGRGQVAPGGATRSSLGSIRPPRRLLSDLRLASASAGSLSW